MRLISALASLLLHPMSNVFKSFGLTFAIFVPVAGNFAGAKQGR